MITQRLLARHLGLSQSTVSLALRNSPLIPEETKARVREAAEQGGYQPNPLVSTLMEHIRGGREVKDHGCLGILVNAKNERDWLAAHDSYRQQYRAIKRQAEKRGYRTECFFLGDGDLSDERIDRIMHARGIPGVILAQGYEECARLPRIDWSRYSCAISGYAWKSLNGDKVAPHYKHNVEHAFSELRRRGYRKIGFCLSKNATERSESAFLAAYFICQHLLEDAEKIPLFIGQPGEVPASAFTKWFRRWKPDALIGRDGCESIWLDEMGIKPGRDIGIVCMFRHLHSDFSSIDENHEVIGEALVDMLAAHIMHNNKGLPIHPVLSLVSGSWWEGTTAPARKTAKAR